MRSRSLKAARGHPLFGKAGPLLPVMGGGLVLASLFMLGSGGPSSSGSKAERSHEDVYRPVESKVSGPRISGLSRVEISVRPPAHPQALRSLVADGGRFDLFFAYIASDGYPKVSPVYRGVSPTWMAPAGTSIWIDVDEGDVPELLALEMAGEFRLIQSGSSGRDEDGSPLLPLGEREWVIALLGLAQVEIVQ